jgi:hypothetical protein
VEKKKLSAIALAASLFASAASAQKPSVPHCTSDQKADHYLCNASAFQRRLDDAHTIRVDADRMDLFARQQMEHLVVRMRKQLSAPEQRPDLIFDMAPIDRSGRINVGPADTALATLNVYDPAMGAGRRGLIWAETFDGQEDRPWPTVVVDLIRQFEEHALKH